MKKFILIVFALIFLFTLSGCEEPFPTVDVHNRDWKSYITIEVSKRYVYKDFDIEVTNEGKDLILHFMEAKR